jgi:hypothetical protein
MTNRSNIRKKVLLIEPNYSNKFPPVGLMKIATYYRNLGNWDVVFYKGDLKLFVIERIADKLVDTLNDTDTSEINWHLYKDILVDYIRTRKIFLLDLLPLDKTDCLLLKNLIIDAKDYYWRGIWKNKSEREWDRVGVTTLFTFYWQITIDTINFAKDLVKDENNLMVGGVLASIQPEELRKEIGNKVRIHVGILYPGDLDKGDTQNIDELELDYSILDEVNYVYPMSNAYYRYTTRGCVRHCPFCAVPILEPVYQSYIPLKKRIDHIKEKYGEQKDLLLMDNNVLASDDFPKIINEIIDSGFKKGAKFFQPNLLEIAIRNLNLGINDQAYIRKSWRLIQEFYKSLKGEDSYSVYCIIEHYHIDKLLTCTKQNLIDAYYKLKDLYSKQHERVQGKLRFVDFNQGVDARLFTQEKVQLLSKIAIKPLRIAFDNVKTEKYYVEAIKMSVRAGLKDFSNYLLYNFDDRPEDLYYRLKINIDLSDELDISIYSFPMKYHPIRKTNDMNEDFSHNRDYIGKYWNRKYIRAIQAILNSTKGKIGKGHSFFTKAFGGDINQYYKILEMPETMIIYRFFFEWLGQKSGQETAIRILGNDSICKNSTQSWWKSFQNCKKNLLSDEWQEVLDFIHKNNFDSTTCDKFSKKQIKELLSFYSNFRKTILEEKSDLYKLKKVYDNNPIKKLKRHIKNNVI